MQHIFLDASNLVIGANTFTRKVRICQPESNLFACLKLPRSRIELDVELKALSGRLDEAGKR